ncbi:PAS domain-containing protein [Natranaeroarchaeum aerophilus]|uniref:PAS domain-containing protein n=1 Tax=Natranaeroarchaeum aerophilus TaxID=2917711 RepID=A0AAE3K3S1_9EURY|nr:PAS domain-containing protein [Natranaeroarchaeum aerophilus]MCL9812832.1 PAS domain-containing protein [Natranaeroarchaeum aerophilus]
MSNQPCSARVPIEELSDPVILVDDRWAIVGGNAATDRLLVDDLDQSLGRPLDDVLQFTDPITGDRRRPSSAEPPTSGCELDSCGPLTVRSEDGSSETVALSVIPIDEADTAAMLLFRPVDTEYDQQRHRDRHRDALYELSIDKSVTEGEFTVAIETITETAADVLGTTRVSVWLFDESGEEMRCVDRYDRQSGEHSTGDRLMAERYPAYFDAVESNRTFAIPDARADPRTAALTESYLEPNGITSMLDAALRDGGDVIGVVCHEQVGEQREWTDDELGFAGNIADLVHRTFRRQQRDRNRTRMEFRRSLLKAQQESVQDGILVVGTEGEFLSYNERFKQLWAVPEEIFERGNEAEALEYARDVLEDPEAFFDLIKRLRADPTATSHDEIRLDSGRILDVYSTPVVGEDGTRYGRLWRCRDITDQRERERELELKNRAIDEAPVGVTITDPDLEDNPMIYVNEQFEQLTGYTSEEVLGRNCRILQGEQTQPRPVAELREAIDEERPVDVELRNYRSDGSMFWNRVTIAPVKDEDGTVRNYVGFQQNVTDRVEASQQLRVLDRVLRHNITNGMNVIVGYAEQLTTVDTGEREAERTIVREADRLIGLTNKHRKIVKLLSEHPRPESIPLWEIARSIAITVRAFDGDAELSIDGSTDVLVDAIPTFEDAIDELLSNAVEHSEREQPRVSIGIEVGETTVAIHVRDYGPGLPHEEASILTGEQRVGPLTHGLGLGLWHVYWIISLSGGSIDVRQTDPGTEITITLHRVDAGETR